MRDLLSAEIFDVLFYEEKDRVSLNSKREYSALSFRLSSKNARFICDGKNIEAPSGSICYVPMGAEYKRTCEKDELIVFHFNESFPVKNEIVVFESKNPEKYKILFVKAEKIWSEKESGYRYKVASLFYEILSELTREGMLLTKNTDSDVAKAIDIIEKNFNNDDFRTEKISEFLYISETFLRRKFKKHIGKSPKQYLDDRRIEEAKKLLESGYFSQKEIAGKCGFSDVKYFRTAFKTATGMKIKDFIKKSET